MVEWSSRPVLAVAVVACLVLGSLGLVAAFSASGHAVAGESHPGGAVAPSALARERFTPSSAATPPTSVNGLAKALAIENGLRAKGISPATVHLPNFARAVTDTAQPITPGTYEAPAPMGVADIGLQNESGVLVPYELNTTSVAGTVNITNLQSVYVDGDGPDTFGIQLNSVVNGVTIFGDSSDEFWSQNYIGYTISTHELTFGDEVWNFSSPSGLFPQNSIYNFSVNGTFGDFPYLYQGSGPTFSIGYPFTLTLYLNTSTLGDRPVLYFNYTLSNSSFRQSASFDYLVFNSTVGTPTQAAPVPYYQANGFDYDPIGLINDMEIDILGNDDGDMTAFTAADATVSLAYWNATAGAMQDVPSAYNAGQETGENAVGLAVYSSGGTNPYALVHAGPSFVGGLWNYSAENGAVADTVTVHPVGEYSFLFINVGSSENASQAQWVPTSTTGTTTFYLPAGATYFLEFMMSEYDPTTQVVTATASVTLPAVHLAYDPTVGIYTPLFAFTNAELASISSAGAGTLGTPYILLNNQYGSLAPQFATWNDYLFPEFPGLLIAGTTAYVQVTPPSFEIDLPAWDFAPWYVAPLGLPLTNNLQLQFYDTANVELVHSGGILGWMSAFQGGFPESSVMFWNCTNSLVLANTFDDQGNALLFYGGTGNLVWGNTFVTTPVVAADPFSVDGAGGWDTGVNETESGDLLYNNQFEVGIPAITITYDPFGCDQYGFCGPVTYNDTWNVTMQPSSNYTIVDGWNLTGSIIGTWYQGGNYWSNYGLGLNPYGVLPYNNSGAITVGGDYVPLIPFTLYPVTFSESGLLSGLPWGLNVTGGAVFTTSPSSLVLDYPNGTYLLSVVAPFVYTTIDTPAEFTVAGSATTVSITFAPLIYVNVEESGLPLGFGWSASINGTGANHLNLTEPNEYPSFITFVVIPGVYSVNATALGYEATPRATYVTVVAQGDYPFASIPVFFTFAPIPGTLNLTVLPTSATVWVNGLQVPLTNGNFTGNETPGSTFIVVSASGYITFYEIVTISSGQTTNVSVQLSAVSPTPGSNASTSSGILGISNTGWAIIAALVVLTVIFLAGMIYFARRPPRGPGVPGAAPAQPWQEPPPASPPPLN